MPLPCAECHTYTHLARRDHFSKSGSKNTISSTKVNFRWRPYRVECTGSLLTSEVKSMPFLGVGTHLAKQNKEREKRPARSQQPDVYLEPKWLRWQRNPPRSPDHAIPWCGHKISATKQGARKKGLRGRNSPMCTLSQNGYGGRESHPDLHTMARPCATL